MRSSPSGTAAREITVPTRTENISESTPSRQKQKWRFWSGVCFAIVLLVVFARHLLMLISYVAGSQLHSYILLVPFVSAYLLYLRRDQLPKSYGTDLPLTIVSLTAGVGLLALTYSLEFAGRAPANSDRIVLLTLSFLCCLAAGGFFFFGRAWMRAAAFPLAYLIFMVPMPDAMRDALETASKSAAAEVANLLFHLSGTPFLRRFALVAFVIPLGILRNGFRILVIGLLCVNVGPQMIHSLIHRRGGPLFFMLSLIPFFLVLWWLRKGDARSRQPE
jgi:exosortase/archaeosortase family protein